MPTTYIKPSPGLVEYVRKAKDRELLIKQAVGIRESANRLFAHMEAARARRDVVLDRIRREFAEEVRYQELRSEYLATQRKYNALVSKI